MKNCYARGPRSYYARAPADVVREYVGAVMREDHTAACERKKAVMREHLRSILTTLLVLIFKTFKFLEKVFKILF